MDLEEIVGGYSGARLLRLRLAEDDLCVKILPKWLNGASVERIREICKIYAEAGVDSLSLRGYGNLETEERHFYIYDFILGESFKEYSNRELSLEETRTAGAEMGRKLRRVKEVNLTEYSVLATDDIDKLTEYGLEKYHELRKDPEMRKWLEEYFDRKQIERLMAEFAETKAIFKKEVEKLIHGDLKRSNMVWGTDGKIHLIDIESMRKSYDVLNLRYQMSWILFEGAEKEREFVRGIFDGLYGQRGERPAGFAEEVRYVLMLNFVEHTAKARQRGEDVREYFERMRKVFAEVEQAGGRSLV